MLHQQQLKISPPYLGIVGVRGKYDIQKVYRKWEVFYTLPIFIKGVDFMSNCISRGDVFYANLQDGVGSEQRGFRPVIIIQNDIGNYFSPTVIAVAITGKINHKAKLPTHCNLTSLKNLGIPSMALAEQIITLDKKRLQKYIGKIADEDVIALNKALSISVGLA